MSLAIMNPVRGWLRAFPAIEPARPCGCQADPAHRLPGCAAAADSRVPRRLLRAGQVSAVTGMPPGACTALGEAIQAYEPEATALIIRSPAALLQVLLEAGRRSLEAAAPHIAAAERERIARLAETEAARGARTGLDRIVLRAFAGRLRDTP
jgi:hypothetical protein